MGDKIKEMLKSIYELEGVLLLAKGRGESTSNIILSLIKEKAGQVSKLAEELQAFSSDEDGQQTKTPAEDLIFSDLSEDDNDVVVRDEDIVHKTSLYEGQDERRVNYDNELEDFGIQAPKEDTDELEEEKPDVEAEFIYNDDETEREDGQEDEPDVETEFIYEEEKTCPEDEEEKSEPDVEAEFVYAEEETVDYPAEDNETSDEFTEESVSGENIGEIEKTPTEVPEYHPNNDCPPPVPEEEKVVPTPQPTEEVEEIESDDEQEVVTLDEAYIRDKSKRLRNAFSINDKFRFQRELFGNNSAEMADAINLADAMNSYAEAEEYFYEDLGWDKESEEVVEFMKIIKNHFL